MIGNGLAVPVLFYSRISLTTLRRRYKQIPGGNNNGRSDIIDTDRSVGRLVPDVRVRGDGDAHLLAQEGRLQVAVVQRGHELRQGPRAARQVSHGQAQNHSRAGRDGGRRQQLQDKRIAMLWYSSDQYTLSYQE